MIGGLLAILRARLRPSDATQVCHLVWAATNAARTSRRLHPVRRHELLDRVAASHSVDMAVRGYFDHRDPEGREVAERIAGSCRELTIRGAGENIARVSTRDDASAMAASILEAWMESTGHRANILNQQWTHMGLGVHQRGGYVYATQVFASVVAELVGTAPSEIPVGVGERFRFRMYELGGQLEELAVIVRVPNDRLRFEHGDGYYSYGWYMVQWYWERDLLVVPFTAQHGPGGYQICVGSRRTGRFIPLLRINSV
jgi:hypothetical protein